MEQVRVSVALASYNGAAYIGEQLESILENLSSEDEIIVSDDGSTDETRHIIAEYERKDARVHLTEGPCNGIIANFEHAIAECRGEYIFLADQDDVWVPGKVEKVLKILEEKGVSLVIHDAKVCNGDLQEEVMPSFFAYRGSGAGVWKNYMKNTYMGCCMAFKKEVKDKVLPIPKDIQMHDQWIGILSDYYFGKSFFLQEPLLLYRRHEQNASDFSHNTVLVMLKNRLRLAGRLLSQIHKNLRKR
ncbi:MAG: glycosyltransferase family 2 protein [Roseburia sp.]